MSCKTETWRFDPKYLLRRCDEGSGIDYDVLPQDATEEARTSNTADGLLAQMRVKIRPEYLAVAYIDVADAYRENRWGTRLYELALAESCRIGKPLSSDSTRSEFSESFWRKQAGKERAKCVPGTSKYWSTPRLELEEKLDNGEITASQYLRMTKNLPEPERDEYGNRVWPCGRFEITEDPCTTTSLDAIKHLRRKARPKARSKARPKARRR